MCQKALILDTDSLPWPPTSTFYTLLDIERRRRLRHSCTRWMSLRALSFMMGPVICVDPARHVESWGLERDPGALVTCASKEGIRMPACLHCRRDTAWNAAVCPHCGATPPHGGAQAHDGLVTILGTLLAMVILTKFFGLW